MGGEPPRDPDTTPTLDPGAGPPAPPTPAKTLGPYAILAELGRGGMGVVYKAFHPGLMRTVALKVLIAGEDASAEAIERFHREAAAVARLGHHPGIVPVHDIGVEGRTHYFAMHYVEGRPLDRLIDEGAVAPRQAARIAKTVADALAHAHAHGILHRDVKPANILLAVPEGEKGRGGDAEPPSPPPPLPSSPPRAEGTHGVPMLTDFGLAKDIASESRMTRSGMTLGTPQYMPPEQAKGDLDAVDERSDVYSLGATLYEMLAARPPFDGDNVMEVVHQVLFKDPASPRRGNPELHQDLETICLKCLEKDADKRYASARALAEDLDRFLEGRPITAKPVSAAGRLWRNVKRNRPLWGIAAASLAVLLAGAAAFAVLYGRSEEARRDKEAQAEEEKARTEALGRLKAKQEKASQVILNAALRLQGVHAALREARFDRSSRGADRGEDLARHAETIESFCASVPPDSASQATVLALQGWLHSLCDCREEALALFARARERDPEVPWGSLFEAFHWLLRTLRLQGDIRMRIAEGRCELIRDFEERPEFVEARRRFLESLRGGLVTGPEGPVEDGPLARLVEGLEGIATGRREVAVAGLSAGLGMSEMGWIRLELLFARAEQQLLLGDLPKALADLESILAEEPGYLSALLFKGNLLLVQATNDRAPDADPRASYSGAVETLEALRERDPRSPTVHVHLALAHVLVAERLAERGADPTGALAKMERSAGDAMRHEPDRVSMLLGRSMIYSIAARLQRKDRSLDPLGALAAMEASLTRVLELEPGHEVALSDLGTCYALRGAVEAERGLDPRASLEACVATRRRALEAHPDAAGVHLNLADGLRLLANEEESRGLDPTERFEEAVRRYGSAVERSSRPWEALSMRGWVKKELAVRRGARGEDAEPLYREALEDCTKALALKADYLTGYANRASVLRVLGERNASRGADPLPRYDEALRDCEEGLARGPGSVSLWDTSGFVALRKAEWKTARGLGAGEDLDHAVAAFTKSIEREPGRADPFGGLGLAQISLANLHASRGEDAAPNLRAAREAFEEEVRLNPNSAGAHDHFGVACLTHALLPGLEAEEGIRILEEGIAHFEESLRLNPISALSRSNLGCAYSLLGDNRKKLGLEFMEPYRKAVACHQEAARLAPGYEKAWNNLGSTHLTIGETRMERGQDPGEAFGVAIEAFNKALDLSPGNGHTLLGLGNAHRQRGAFLAAQGRDPGEDLHRSIAYLSQALETNPDHASAHVGLGLAHVLVGEDEEKHRRDPVAAFRMAIQSFDRCLTRIPGHFPALRHRASARQKLGHALAARGEDPRACYRDAVADVEAAIRGGALPADLNLLGFLHMDLGGAEQARGGDPLPWFAKAVAFYEEGDRILPSNTILLGNLARAHLRIGDRLAKEARDPRAAFETALETWKRVGALEPGDAGAAFMSALVLGKLGDARAACGIPPWEAYREAVRLYETLPDDAPFAAGVFQNLSLLHEKLGNLEAARDAVAEAIRRQRTPPAALRESLAGFEALLAAPEWVRTAARGSHFLGVGYYEGAREFLERGLSELDEEALASSPELRKNARVRYVHLASVWAQFSAGRTAMFLPPAEVAKDDAEAFRAKAFAALDRAVALGWTDFEDFRRAAKLAPLRDAPEFEARMAAWEGKRK